MISFLLALVQVAAAARRRLEETDRGDESDAEGGGRRLSMEDAEVESLSVSTFTPTPAPTVSPTTASPTTASPTRTFSPTDSPTVTFAPTNAPTLPPVPPCCEPCASRWACGYDGSRHLGYVYYVGSRAMCCTCRENNDRCQHITFNGAAPRRAARAFF